MSQETQRSAYPTRLGQRRTRRRDLTDRAVDELLGLDVRGPRVGGERAERLAALPLGARPQATRDLLHVRRDRQLVGRVDRHEVFRFDGLDFAVFSVTDHLPRGIGEADVMLGVVMGQSPTLERYIAEGLAIRNELEGAVHGERDAGPEIEAEELRRAHPDAERPRQEES